MDKLLNTIELRIQLLLEHHDFDALNEADKQFILTHMSEDDYHLKRIIITDARQMDEEAHTVPDFVSANVMAHLAGEKKKRAFWINEKVPVYYALLAAATVALLFMVLTKFTQNNPKEAIETVQEVHRVDTVFSEITKLDTVVQYVDRPVYIVKKQEDRTPFSTVNNADNAVEERLVQSQMRLPDLEKLDLTNKGSSLRQDDMSFGFESANTLGMRRD